jgi:hypothetical protein
MQHIREANAHVVMAMPPRSELAAAFRCLWHASARWHEWPPTMHRQAAVLFATCFRYGGIDDTVARLTDAEAASAVSDLRRFVDDAERFHAPPAVR